MAAFDFQCLELQLDPPTEQFGRFAIQPLEIGCGMSIGTIIRRVLLTNIFGLRIVGVRIAKINNEFGTIPGVKEDVLEILLNLKEVIFQCTIDDARFWDQPIGHLRIEGPAVITAGSFQLAPHIKVINPSHYIATVGENSALVLEAYLDWGKSYTLAENQKPRPGLNCLDYLKIDSLFMPVSRVSCQIELMNVNPTSNDRAKEKEQLIIDLWTNGSLTPDQAFSEAIKVILDWFKVIQNAQNFAQGKFDSPEQEQEFFRDELKKLFEENPDDDELFEDEVHTIPIEHLNLSVRSYNALKRAQINFVDDLAKYSINDLKQLKNFGQKSLKEVMDVLEDQFEIVLR